MTRASARARHVRHRPGVELLRGNRSLVTRQVAWRGIHDFEPSRLIVAPSKLIQLGIEPGRIDQGNPLTAKHLQGAQSCGAGRDNRDAPGSLLKPGSHRPFGLRADHVSRTREAERNRVDWSCREKLRSVIDMGRVCRSGVSGSVVAWRIGWMRRRSAPSLRARRGPGTSRTARPSSCSSARTAISRCVRKRGWPLAGSRSNRTSSARNPRGSCSAGNSVVRSTAIPAEAPRPGTSTFIPTPPLSDTFRSPNDVAAKGRGPR